MSIYVIKSIFLIITLTFCAILDIRKKEIPVWPVIVAGVIVAVLSVFDLDRSAITSILGALVGAVLIVISKVTKGAIGIGDAIIMIIIGISLGVFGALIVLFYALFFAAVVSIVLLCLRKVSKKDTIPLIPFLLISYLGVLFV